MAPVFWPVPITPRPSTWTYTAGGSAVVPAVGVEAAGSVTTVAVITTGPENFTVSGSPVFTDEAVPETWTVKVDTVVWASAPDGASSSAASTPHSREDRIPRHVFILRSISSLNDFNSADALIMIGLVRRLVRGRQDVFGGNEGHTLRRGDGRRQRLEEGRAVGVDFPPQQHRVVLVHRVVAVLHVHSAEVAQLHQQGHASARAQAVDVLAAALPGGNVGGAAVAGDDLAFLEVDVDGVIPAAAAVLQRPLLEGVGAAARSGRDAAVARVQHRALVVGLDAPGTREVRLAGRERLRCTGAPLEVPGAGDCPEGRVGDERIRNLALVGNGR